MKVKDLLKALEGVDTETEVIGGAWNGWIDTYKVMDVLGIRNLIISGVTFMGHLVRWMTVYSRYNQRTCST